MASNTPQLNGNDLRFSNSKLLFGGGGRNHNLTRIMSRYSRFITRANQSLNQRARNAWNKKIGKKRRRPKKLKIKIPPVYKKYIKSVAWFKRRDEYFKVHKKECVACFSKERIVLHHVNYQRLGAELDSDLIVLCWDCHNELHETHDRASEMKGNLYKLTNEFIDEKRQLLEFPKIY